MDVCPVFEGGRIFGRSFPENRIGEIKVYIHPKGDRLSKAN